MEMCEECRKGEVKFVCLGCGRRLCPACHYKAKHQKLRCCTKHGR